MASLQRHAAQIAKQSITERIAALERYAKEVQRADAAYRDWEQSEAITRLTDQHLDALARTVADEHGGAQIGRLSPGGPLSVVPWRQAQEGYGENNSAEHGR
jgi:hypothetical protein